jgi:hypothetical protein
MNYTGVQDERSLGDLFAQLSQETRTLVSQEVQLVKAEMGQKAAKAGRELAFVTVGAMLAEAALLALVAALVLALAQIMEPWVAALVVGVALAIVGALLIGKGLGALRNMTPVPERALASLREDREWIAQEIA